ncbi:uncharacterized protein DEA37_0001327 [Paragonimus westermani]|uniref:Uncharacterized protein n=1 Tax=Paragonimus westermani TaxID=34504 RepID=A0A5J4NCW3_9TREM|nr:uncharacterized protein DEA37_0001327 [Paragonimus westermani]
MPVDRRIPWVCAECQKEGYSVAIGTLSDSVTIPTSSNVSEDSVSIVTGEVDNTCDEEIENDTPKFLEEASSAGIMTITEEHDEQRLGSPTSHTTGSSTAESDLVTALSVEHTESANQTVLNPIAKNPSIIRLHSPHSLYTAEPADSNPSPSNSEVTPVTKPVTTTHSPNLKQSKIKLVQHSSPLSAPDRMVFHVYNISDTFCVD